MGGQDLIARFSGRGVAEGVDELPAVLDEPGPAASAEADSSEPQTASPAKRFLAHVDDSSF